MVEPTNVPLPERVKYFRELARRSQREAQRSRGSLRVAFVRLAAGWERLANTAEDLLATQAIELAAAEIGKKEAPAELESHGGAL